MTDENKDSVRYGETHVSVPVDIDTAYTKIKREFGFLTKKEWVKSHVYWDHNFQWEALPGVSYHMRDYVGHHYQGINRKQYIDIQLNKNNQLTDIQVQFSITDSGINVTAFGESIKKRVLVAINAR